MAMNHQLNEFMSACQSGNLHRVRDIWYVNSKNLPGPDATDSNGQTGLIHASKGKHRDVINYLLETEADVNFIDKEGKQALHYAANCEKAEGEPTEPEEGKAETFNGKTMNEIKQVCMLLVLEKAEVHTKDLEEKVPAEDNGDLRMFIEEIYDEQLCFKILTPDQKKTITDIFYDACVDGEITLQRSAQFNKYLEPTASRETQARDAKDFIETCALINKETVK